MLSFSLTSAIRRIHRLNEREEENERKEHRVSGSDTTAASWKINRSKLHLVREIGKFMKIIPFPRYHGSTIRYIRLRSRISIISVQYFNMFDTLKLQRARFWKYRRGRKHAYLDPTGKNGSHGPFT